MVVQPSRHALASVLGSLYARQQERGGHCPYLLAHARPRCIANQVRTFRWYEPHLPPAGPPTRVLDWGCRHAPDSCLLRATHGADFEVHACDFVPGGTYPAFHDFAGLSYTMLTDLVRLPYPDNFFHAVIASGVLEHAARDYDSLF